MKIDGNNIKPGNVIEHKGGLWRAVKTQHTQPGGLWYVSSCYRAPHVPKISKTEYAWFFLKLLS